MFIGGPERWFSVGRPHFERNTRHRLVVLGDDGHGEDIRPGSVRGLDTKTHVGCGQFQKRTDGVSHHCRNVSLSRRSQLRDLGHVLPSNLLDLQRESSHPRGRAVHHHSRLLGLFTCVIEFVFQHRPLCQSRLKSFRVLQGYR